MATDSEKPSTVRFLIERPNIPILIALTLFLISFFVYPIALGLPVSNFILANSPLIFFGVVVLLIPLFIQATKATLTSDLIDQEMLPAWSRMLKDFDNFDSAPLKMSVARLYLAKADSRSSSMKNLALGVGFSVVTLTLLIQLSVSANTPAVLALSTDDFLIKHIGPKLGAVFFIQLIAAFFFRHYSKNLKEISVIGDKLLFIEIKLAALQVSDMHREKLQAFLVDFDIQAALTSQFKSQTTTKAPTKLVETVKLSLGK